MTAVDLELAGGSARSGSVVLTLPPDDGGGGGSGSGFGMQVFNLTDPAYGGVPDRRIVTDGVATGTAFSSATIALVTADTGKTITIVGAGVGGALYIGTITRTSATTGTLSPAASTPVVGARVSLGTDNTAAITAMFDAHYAAGGGVCYAPAGLTPNRAYLVTGQIIWPHDTPAPASWQPPMVLCGDGMASEPRNEFDLIPRGGTQFDLQYTGAGYKMETFGRGRLTIRDLAFVDNGDSTTPFGISTGTTMDINHVSVNGNPHKIWSTCDQDFWYFGGTGQALLGNSLNDPHQGYSSRLVFCSFNRMRSWGWARAYGNAVHMDYNWGLYCGSNSAGVGAINFDPVVPVNHFLQGGSACGNEIEIGHYPHSVRIVNTIDMQFENNFYDQTEVSLSAYYVDASSHGCTFRISEVDLSGAMTLFNAEMTDRHLILSTVPHLSALGAARGAQSLFGEGLTAPFIGVGVERDYPAAFGGGVGVLVFKDAPVIPTANPPAGYTIMYGEAGVVKLRDAAGVITPLNGITDFVVATVDVLPATTTVSHPDAYPYTATCKNAAGQTLPGAAKVWSISAGGTIATVDSSTGVVSSVGPAGTATVRCTSGAVYGEASFVVAAVGAYPPTAAADLVFWDDPVTRGGLLQTWNTVFGAIPAVNGSTTGVDVNDAGYAAGPPAKDTMLDGDYISYGDAAAIDAALTGPTGWTFVYSFDANANDLSQTTFLFIKDSGAPPNQEMLFIVTSTGVFAGVRYGGDVANYEYFQGGAAIGPPGRYVLSMTYDPTLARGSRIKVYSAGTLMTGSTGQAGTGSSILGGTASLLAGDPGQHSPSGSGPRGMYQRPLIAGELTSITSWLATNRGW